MEKALIIDALGKSKHPALEVEYWHTESIGAGTYDAKVHAKTEELKKIFKTLTNK